MSGNGTVRLRPLKQFRWLTAYGPFRKGDVFQPTGIYRSQLLARGLIEEVVEAPVIDPVPVADAEEAPAPEDAEHELPLDLIRPPDGRRRKGC